MKTFEMTERQKEEYIKLILSMMNSIHCICVENDLKYTLIGGSLLGAIRHKGFIPWDDDLDIALPRPDYEKLCNHLKDYPIKGCFLQNYSTDLHYNQPYAKLRMDGTKYIENYSKKLHIHQGIFIDIFPLDKIDNPKSKSAKYRQKLIRMLTFAIWGKEKCFMKRKGIKKLEHVISAIIDVLPKKVIISMQHKLAYREKKPWDYRASMYGNTDKPYNLYFNISDFDNLVLVPFEDIELHIVPTWQEVLTRVFKNYMEYPPIDKRNSGHDVIAISFDGFSSLAD